MATVQEFISQALTEISGALLDFESSTEIEGLSVFPLPRYDGDRPPPDLTRVGLFVTEPFRGRYVVPVQFDLLVEVTEEATATLSGKAKAGGKASFMRVVSGSAGVAGSTDREKSEASRSTQHVQFSIPLQLPNEEDRGK